MVLLGGKEFPYHEAGLANLWNRSPDFTRFDFRLYSMTKAITATAAMILAERGEIDFCEPVV